MPMNKPGETGPAFGRSSAPYKPGEKPGVNATEPGPDMESVPTPRNTQVDAATQPAPVTGAATTPLGKKLQPAGAPNVSRDPRMPADPVPNPHIPSSTLKSTAVEVPGRGPDNKKNIEDDDDPMAEKEADKIAADLEDTPHPEHVAGKVAVKHFEAKTNDELDAGKKAVQSPHRRK